MEGLFEWKAISNGWHGLVWAGPNDPFNNTLRAFLAPRAPFNNTLRALWLRTTLLTIPYGRFWHRAALLAIPYERFWVRWADGAGQVGGQRGQGDPSKIAAVLHVGCRLKGVQTMDGLRPFCTEGVA